MRKAPIVQNETSLRRCNQIRSQRGRVRRADTRPATIVKPRARNASDDGSGTPEVKLSSESCRRDRIPARAHRWPARHLLPRQNAIPTLTSKLECFKHSSNSDTLSGISRSLLLLLSPQNPIAVTILKLECLKHSSYQLRIKQTLLHRLFPLVRAEVLRLLFTNRGTELYTRELAGLSSLALRTVQDEVAKLEAAGSHR